eukprot:3823-Heterococcus_DN1.PRE.1
MSKCSTINTANTAVLQQSSCADAVLSSHNALLKQQHAILQNVALHIKHQLLPTHTAISFCQLQLKPVATSNTTALLQLATTTHSIEYCISILHMCSHP